LREKKKFAFKYMNVVLLNVELIKYKLENVNGNIMGLHKFNTYLYAFKTKSKDL
jgi:hypothetical protein